MEASEWRTLRPGSVEQLPAEPGVFELGTLVRSVLLVGGEPDRPLRDAVRDALAAPGVALHARCIRFLLVEDPVAAVQARLAEYRQGHAGNLPPEQPRRPQLSTAAARRAAPSRVALASRAGSSSSSRGTPLPPDDALSA